MRFVFPFVIVFSLIQRPGSQPKRSRGVRLKWRSRTPLSLTPHRPAGCVSCGTRAQRRNRTGCLTWRFSEMLPFALRVSSCLCPATIPENAAGQSASMFGPLSLSFFPFILLYLNNQIADLESEDCKIRPDPTSSLKIYAFPSLAVFFCFLSVSACKFILVGQNGSVFKAHFTEGMYF